jgi:hypothetical protein
MSASVVRVPRAGVWISMKTFADLHDPVVSLQVLVGDVEVALLVIADGEVIEQLWRQLRVEPHLQLTMKELQFDRLGGAGEQSGYSFDA